MSLIPAKAYDLYFELARRDIHLSITADGQTLATDKPPSEFSDLAPEIMRLEKWIVEIVKSRQSATENRAAIGQGAPLSLAMPEQPFTPSTIRAAKALTALEGLLGSYAPMAIKSALRCLESAVKANDNAAYFWSCLSTDQKHEMAICRALRQSLLMRAPLDKPETLPSEIKAPKKIYARRYSLPE